MNGAQQITRTGGGKFDPHEENVYFLASNTERLRHAYPAYTHLLLAVNELEGQDSMDFFVQAVNDPEKRVFLDSGVYNLAMSHARAHNMTMDAALSLAPADMDGFNDLFERYVHLVRTYGERLWGYIEIDQGGRENKIKTRARLEALGLRPIPVYHPLNDGWEYFDYLAERYDRICFGNIVKASIPMRQRLLTTAWERRRRYPHLWIHLLGLTPNQWLNAFPINSGDSSSWLASVRWTRFTAYCDGQSLGDMGLPYRYIQGTEPDSPSGSRKGTMLSAYMVHFGMLAWRRHIQELIDEGFEVYPPISSREKVRRANGE